MDDLNNPVCVPWQGKNAATTSNLGNTSAFKYNASVPGTAREVPIGWPNNLPSILYAKTPYADYVQQFFTNSILSTVYTPDVLKPFVNYSLDNFAFTTALPYWGYSSGGDKRNLFVAAFDSVNGSKIPNQSFVTNSTLTGNALSPNLFSFSFPSGNDNIENGYLNRGVSRLNVE